MENEKTMKSPFDELAKTLAIAKEVPRRDALRLIGGGLAGAILASFGVGKAFGQGNSDCAHFCTSVFPPGPDRGQCISDAAHHMGLCYQCGPAAPPEDHGPLCGQVCCDLAQVCQGGTCVTCSGVRCGQGCCEPGQICQDGTCVTVGVCSGTGGGCGQSSVCGDNCFCFETTEGSVACTSDVNCGGRQPCSSSEDCAFGWVCTTNTCCEDNQCAPLCNGGDGEINALQINSGTGLMASGRVF